MVNSNENRDKEIYLFNYLIHNDLIVYSNSMIPVLLSGSENKIARVYEYSKIHFTLPFDEKISSSPEIINITKEDKLFYIYLRNNFEFNFI